MSTVIRRGLSRKQKELALRLNKRLRKRPKIGHLTDALSVGKYCLLLRGGTSADAAL